MAEDRKRYRIVHAAGKGREASETVRDLTPAQARHFERALAHKNSRVETFEPVEDEDGEG